MLRRDSRLDDLARLPQTGFQGIDDDDAAFIRMLMMMVFVVRFDGMAQDVGMDLTHVGTIAAYQTYVSPFLSAFGAGEVLGREERGAAGRAEEDGIRLADVLLQQPLVFAVLGGDDAEGQFRVRVAEIFPFGRGVEFVHELFGAGKGAVDDVDVVDRGPTQHESEADVPFRLQARTEHGDGVDVGADVEDYGCREGGPESRQFFRVKEGVGYAGGCEERQGATGCSGLRRRDGRICGRDARQGGCK